MEYTNAQIRRQDRLLDKEKAMSLLRNGEYGVLSMQTEEGEAYGIPVNYVWNGDASIYIHCAPEGRKLHCITHCNQVSFCIVGKTHVISNQFTTEYESLVLSCKAHIGLNEEERMSALHLLIDKYSPNDKAVGAKYAEKSFHRTEVIRLDIENGSGKSKSVPKKA
ncbi:pyridoxamine 5'-phosphate oxidase family protein [Phocaeicola sp.]